MAGLRLTRNYVLLILICLMFFGGSPVRGQMGGVFDHSFMLKGPWDLLVQTSANQSFSFPVGVEKENQSQPLDMSFPVLGTPIKVQLQHYLPDLVWAAVVEEKQGRGSIVQLVIEGPDLEQERWLDSADPQRQMISSSIGRVFLEKYEDRANFPRNLRQLADPCSVGVMKIRLKDLGVLLELVVKPQQVISIPGTAYRITILEFYPHYSRNTEMNAESNLSDQPVNPAIKVKVENGETSYEKWLWARFPSFVHTDQTDQATLTDSLEMNYRYFNFFGPTQDYVMVVDPNGANWMLRSEEEGFITEKPALEKGYPFTDEYRFTVKQIHASAELKYEWRNGTEELRRPAIVVLFGIGEDTQEVVLELGKPEPLKVNEATYMLHFKKKMESGD